MSIRDRVRRVKHLQHRHFVCVLEDPKNLVNIASAIRNISAFGVEKLYVIGEHDAVADFETSRSNRSLLSASVGASKWVYVRRFATAEACVEHLRRERYTIAITSPRTLGKTNVTLYEGDFTQKRLAVWFGNEAAGVSPVAADAADLCVQIPMGGVVESLNLGTATGIVLSFISYQRLRFVFDRRKHRSMPRGLAEQKLESWEEFLRPVTRGNTPAGPMP